MGKYSKSNTSTTSRSTPKASPAQKDNSSIGKSGVTQGEKSTEGGQYPFMPPCSSYEGSRYPDVTPGQTGENTKLPYPFLPSSVNDKKDT